MAQEPDRSSDADEFRAELSRFQSELRGLRARFRRRPDTGEDNAADDAADDETVEAPAAAEPREGRREVVGRYALPVVIAALVAYVSLHNHFDGVDWGDDFALYMRQAKALTIGNIGEVFADTRFAVDNSGWNSFSPYAYPWGWPLLVAPFYVLFGLDYEVFKVLEVVALCAFLLTFFALVQRRAGARAAALVTLLIGLSPIYTGATDSVLSDIPYLGFVGFTLWWLDRCRLRGILTVDRGMLVVLGLLLAYTFNIRREGVGLVFGLVALHAAVIGRIAIRDGIARARRNIDWRRVGLPYATLVSAVVGFHLLLPTMFLPRTTGTGLSNIPDRFRYYQEAIAEQVGLKDAGATMRVFSSETWARRALALLLLLAVFGMVARLLRRLEEDVALAAYFSTACLIALVSPHQEPRYVFAITPFLVYFAYQAMPTIVALSAWGKRAADGAAVVAAVAVAALVLSNGAKIARSYDYHSDYQYTVHGPESTEAKQMMATVREVTRGDDVILFFRARAMMLYAERRALQGSDLDRMLKRVDWYAMEKGSDYSQTEINDNEAAARGLTKAWENTKWVLWRVPQLR